MKFKIGDKVRVKGELSVRDGNGITYAVKDMLKYRNEIMTVKDVRSSMTGNYTIYELDDNGECWAWTEEMLEPAYAEGGYVPYGKIPTPSNPVPIEEQLGLPEGVSIHDLPINEWYRPLDIVFNAEQAEELARRVNDELNRHFNAFSNNGILAKKEGKNPMKFTFYTTEDYRMDKSNNTKIPTITTHVHVGRDYHGMATCDKADYSERQGCLEAIANAMFGSKFDREYNRAVKENKDFERETRTCDYCGKVFDTVEERKNHEAWHVERRKARHERYKLRKRAKEIAFEEAAQKLAKEMTGEK